MLVNVTTTSTQKIRTRVGTIVEKRTETSWSSAQH